MSNDLPEDIQFEDSEDGSHKTPFRCPAGCAGALLWSFPTANYLYCRMCHAEFFTLTNEPVDMTAVRVLLRSVSGAHVLVKRDLADRNSRLASHMLGDMTGQAILDSPG